MKKLLYLFMAATVLFTSCKKDDGAMDTEDNEANIVGTWKLISVTENGESLSIGNCDILTTFNENGSGTIIDPEPPNCENTESFNFTYSVSGNQLTINEDGESSLQEIETLSETQLVLTYEESFEGNIDVYRVTYSKQ